MEQELSLTTEAQKKHLVVIITQGKKKIAIKETERIDIRQLRTLVTIVNELHRQN